MTHYQQIIAEATKRSDLEELRTIEDCMRQDIFHSTLDWQTKRQLMKGARDAVAVLVEMGELKALAA